MVSRRPLRGPAPGAASRRSRRWAAVREGTRCGTVGRARDGPRGRPHQLVAPGPRPDAHPGQPQAAGRRPPRRRPRLPPPRQVRQHPGQPEARHRCRRLLVIGGGGGVATMPWRALRVLLEWFLENSCIAALLHCCIPPFGHACSGDRARACGRPNAVPPTREVDFFFFPRGGRRGMNWMEVPSAPGRALLELSLASSSPQAVAPCEPPRPSIHRTASRGHARPGVGASRRARGAPWRAGTHNT